MRKDKMILGADVVVSTDCQETGLNNNVLICGSSGCGKTMSVIEPRLLETYNSNPIVTVTKRRIIDKYKPVFRKRGYQVLDMNLIEPMQGNVIYDPLQYVKSYKDARFLADSIIGADPRKKDSKLDPYWDMSAASLLTAEIGYIQWIKKEKGTFADVLDLNDRLHIKPGRMGFETTLDSEFEWLCEKNPQHYVCSCWKTFRELPEKTALCVMETMNVTIDAMFSPELRCAIANRKNIDFQAFAGNKTALFISTSAVNTSTHYFVNMFYAQAFKQLFEYAQTCPAGRLPIPVHMLCDDFATGGRILKFPEYISIFREAQISVTMLIQSESQLRAMYSPEDAVTIINNCDTYVYMGGMDISTSKNISIRLNEPLEDVLYMPVNRAVVFRRGSRPIVTERYHILEDERYQKVTAAYEEAQKRPRRQRTPAFRENVILHVNSER